MTYPYISLFRSSITTILIALVFVTNLSLSDQVNAKVAGDTVITTVAANLHNPRGLNFGTDGGLYVTEAGGDGTATAMCGVMGDNSTKCFANTGSITRIDISAATQERIYKNLPSLIAPNGVGTGATGVHDISFDGLGNAFVTMGLGGNPKWRKGYFDTAGAS